MQKGKFVSRKAFTFVLKRCFGFSLFFANVNLISNETLLSKLTPLMLRKLKLTACSLQSVMACIFYRKMRIIVSEIGVWLNTSLEENIHISETPFNQYMSSKLVFICKLNFRKPNKKSIFPRELFLFCFISFYSHSPLKKTQTWKTRWSCLNILR